MAHPMHMGCEFLPSRLIACMSLQFPSTNIKPAYITTSCQGEGQKMNTYRSMSKNTYLIVSDVHKGSVINFIGWRDSIGVREDDKVGCPFYENLHM